jgi:DivIVA domain-containing protein
MAGLLLVLVGALVVALIACGVAALITGSDPGLSATEPDGPAASLPLARPLVEEDLSAVRFTTVLRGYRMAQVDAVLRRTAYDIGYKQELIAVLEAEVAALRDGRLDDAEVLRRAREAALGGANLGAEDVEPPEHAPDSAPSPDTSASEDPIPAADTVPAPDTTPSAGARPAEAGEDSAGPSPVGSGTRLTKHRGSTR